MNGCAGLARVLSMAAVALAVLAPPARAADPPSNDKPRRPALLQAGAAASRAKKWQTCIDAYAQATTLEESPPVFGELGLCEEAAGHFASAHPHLKRAVAGLPPGDPQRARYQAALGRVAEQVAIVFVTVTPTDARLVVDGHPLGRGEGRTVAIDPGRHVFTALLEGHTPASKTLTVNAREMPHLELSLTPSPPTAGAGKPPPPSPSAPTLGLHTSPAPVANKPVAPIPAPVSTVPVPFAWCVPAPSARGVLGPAACAGVLVLAASAGTAIGLTVHADSLRDSMAARGFTATSCAGGPLAKPRDCDDLLARGQQRDTARDVLIGAGITAGALVGAAAVAIMVEPLNARVALGATAAGGGIAVQGVW